MARATAGPSRTHSQILSTYRLQFHKGFPFSAGARLAGYLAGLGISHVYASPILEARPGSQHCYDVVSSYIQANEEVRREFLEIKHVGSNEEAVKDILRESEDNQKEAEDFLKNYLQPSFP